MVQSGGHCGRLGVRPGVPWQELGQARGTRGSPTSEGPAWSRLQGRRSCLQRTPRSALAKHARGGVRQRNAAGAEARGALGCELGQPCKPIRLAGIAGILKATVRCFIAILAVSLPAWRALRLRHSIRTSCPCWRNIASRVIAPGRLLPCRWSPISKCGRGREPSAKRWSAVACRRGLRFRQTILMLCAFRTIPV